jgi:DNA-binding NarL/FixJ family response regulator
MLEPTYSTKKISIGWAEDNLEFSFCVSKYLISEARSWLDLIFVVANGQEMIDRLENEHPSLVLLDIRMPILDGLETSKIIKKKFPKMKIIAFTEFDNEFNIVELYKIGIKSFIGKSQVSELLRAIRVVDEGGTYIPDKIADKLQGYLKRNDTDELWNGCLTEFEKYLIQAICDGKSSSQIGKEVCKSHRTVEEHRENLYRKLNVRSKAELIIKAVRFNLVKIP